MTLTEDKEETIEELSLREPRGVIIMKRRHWKKRRRKLQMKKRKKRQSRVLSQDLSPYINRFDQSIKKNSSYGGSF